MTYTNLMKNIDIFSKNHALLTPHTRIVIGLSGGPDSVFLLYYLVSKRAELNLTLIAAHLDHEWRAESAKDVEFCAQLCEDLGVPFVHKRLSQLSLTGKFNGSHEAYGRYARRTFFEQVMQEQNAHAIALGHHAQDQQETFFIRLVRGTTLSGLTCMQPRQGHYIRPLLETNKATILTYLQEHDIAYLTDPTNVSMDFLRNRIRSQILPALELVDERWNMNFLRTLHHLQTTDDFLERITHKTLDAISDKQMLSLAKLLELDPVLQYRALLHWLIAHKVPFTPTHALLEEIMRFLRQPGSKKHELHTRWVLVKQKDTVFIEHKEE